MFLLDLLVKNTAYCNVVYRIELNTIEFVEIDFFNHYDLTILTLNGRPPRGCHNDKFFNAYHAFFLQVKIFLNNYRKKAMQVRKSLQEMLQPLQPCHWPLRP